MKNLPIRNAFYTLAGITSALIGWNISQIVWQEIGALLAPYVPKGFGIPSYIILLVIITPSIAIGMVIAEIFISNPTRYKINWKVLTRTSLKLVIVVGAFIGLILSFINWMLLISNWPASVVRIISWITIGAFAGLSESISWSWRSIEGTGNRVQQRIIQSTSFGASAGLLAALCCEGVNTALGGYQEPFGFFLFGTFLGLFLSFASTPAYQVALRAGTGFEAKRTPKRRNQNTQLLTNNAPTQIQKPTLNNQALKYIPDGNYTHIEEGISIQLPGKGKKPLIIGSGDDVDIYIPHLPEQSAALQITSGGVILRSLAEDSVQVQQRMLQENRPTTLKHNQIITLYHENDENKFYRFIFYNRLLDPQA